MEFHCRTMNWEDKGRSDAMSGLAVQSEQLKSCSTHPISKAVERYSEGRTKGLKDFCTYEGGLNFGKIGGQYHETCPKALETAFLKGYSQGRLEYTTSTTQNEQEGNK